MALGALGAGSASAAPLFPDLKTLPPRNLHLGMADVAYDGGGPLHHVLRFSNTVWNAGAGTLILHGRIDPATQRGQAYQRVENSDGTSTDSRLASFFYYHRAHQHYHFDAWGRYELWKRADYDSWLAGGRGSPSVSVQGSKTTSCALDEEFVAELPSTPPYGKFPFSGCSPSGPDNQITEGLASGWGDTYDYTRFDQWIDLGNSPLADGDYVLRSVVDPLNRIHEGPGTGAGGPESEQDNEASTPVRVQGGHLVDLTSPTGSVQINDVDRRTASPRVRVAVLGRDDVAGVNQFRLSSDGHSWQTPHDYTADATDSDRQTVDWDLSDTRYGGGPDGGARRVYVQFRDAAGHWGPPMSDTIDWANCSSSTGVSSRYAAAVLADRPVSYWRLGETCGTVATDARRANRGTFVGSPALGARGLIADERGSTGVGFDGRGQWVTVGPSPSLDLWRQLSLEAWVRPAVLPGPHRFASIVSKAGAYSLQFDGPRAEFALVHGDTVQRVLAPAGAVQAGRAYLLAGTWDGAVQRLYLNGRLVAGARAQTPSIVSAPLLFAAWRPGEELLAGTLDEVAVFDHALSRERVAAHLGSASRPPVLPAPTNLRAVARRSRGVRLTWADDASRETGLRLERSRDRRFRSASSRRLRPHITSFVDVHARRGTVYFYRLRALGVSHQSAWSRASRVRTRGRRR